MPGFLHIMRSVGRAIVKNGAGALVNLVPFGNALFEIAKDALEDYRKGQSNSEAALRAELEAVAQASPAEVRKVAEEVAAAETKGQPDQIRLTLVSTLSRMQDSTRHSLRRPADPSGKTVPAGLSLKTPTDLMQFLPTRPPRFKPGDKPLPGVGWELEKLLGVGGFGEVWKAHHPKLTNITAALKFCLDPEAGAALLNEGANLNHVLKAGHQAGIVQLKNAYLDAEPYCLEYEFIEGDDLAGAIHSYQSAKGPLTPEMATRIIRDLARPVGRVHKLSPPIVHRDLKPANVLVRTREGKSEFLITDFGIGGVAASQALEQTRQDISSTPMLTSLQGAHTPLYASPEQKKGEPPDPRDDVHALGVIWYQLLVGDMSQAPPFDWIAELQSLKVESNIIDLLGRCIAGKAERRPANAAALTEQMEKLLGRPKPASIPAITIVSSGNPAVYGEAVTFTVTVKAAPPAAGTPTGKVAFMDGATVLGEAPLSEGAATLTASALCEGSHTITVSYSGDAAFSACKSASLSQIVLREDTGERSDSEHEAKKPPRREETLTVLTRRGLIQEGSEIELIPDARPENASEQNQKLFRARIHGSSRRKSVVWLHDNNVYSLTSLTCKLAAEHGAQWLADKIACHWRRVGHTRTLWEEASHLLGQEGMSSPPPEEDEKFVPGPPPGAPSVDPPAPARLYLERMMHRNTMAVPRTSSTAYALLRLVATKSNLRRLPRHIVLVLDITTSMCSQDGTGLSRLRRVQDALLQAVDRHLKPEDTLAIVAFGATTELVLPTTCAHKKERISAAIQQLTHYDEAPTGRAMGAAIAEGMKELEKASAPGQLKDLLVLICGETTDEPLCRHLAQEAAAKKIRFDIVGVGTDWNANLIKDLAKVAGEWGYIDVDDIHAADRFLEHKMGELAAAEELENRFCNVEMHLWAMKGIKIKRVWHLEDSRAVPLTEPEPLHVVADFGGLTFGQTTDCLLEMSVPTCGEGKYVLMRINVDYSTVSGRETTGLVDLSVEYSSAGNGPVNPTVRRAIEELGV